MKQMPSDKFLVPRWSLFPIFGGMYVGEKGSKIFKYPHWRGNHGLITRTHELLRSNLCNPSHSMEIYSFFYKHIPWSATIISYDTYLHDFYLNILCPCAWDNIGSKCSEHCIGSSNPSANVSSPFPNWDHELLQLAVSSDASNWGGGEREADLELLQLTVSSDAANWGGGGEERGRHDTII